ncbi:zonadhesin-like [Atheta coriaria]|uniref:zonadhesin-like n=1 Tax=Dalotia coriaria TaxID=877792 RepID=UPI0031F474B9
MMCTPGCECKSGYVISSTTGKCIPETSCPIISPVVCPGNTTYQECAFNQQCSKTSCQSAIPKNCKPGCACRDGYLENANGNCVLPADCDSKINCSGLDPNSEFSLCGTCRRSCDDKSPICDAKCHIGCFCKKGYVLDKPDGKCIPEKSCPTKPKHDDSKKDKSKPKKDDSKRTNQSPRKMILRKTHQNLNMTIQRRTNQNPRKMIPRKTNLNQNMTDPDQHHQKMLFAKNKIPILNIELVSHLAASRLFLPETFSTGIIHKQNLCSSSRLSKQTTSKTCPKTMIFTDEGRLYYCGNKNSDYKKNNCVCPPGYRYDRIKSICVEPCDCSYSDADLECYKKDPNTEYYDCKSDKCVPTCESQYPDYCNKKCTVGCHCKQGLLQISEKNATCVLPSQCPQPQCCQHSTYTDKCIESKRCDNMYLNFAQALCDGVKRCVCNPGYVMNSKQECVLPQECKPEEIRCPQNMEYSTCHTCEKQCDNLDPVCTKECKVGCFCIKDHALNSENVCVPIKDCPAKCPANEEHKQCKSLTPATCSNLLTQSKPKICKEVCVAGCDCKSGFVRNEKQVCVEPSKCPQTELKCGVNMVYTGTKSKCSTCPSTGKPTFTMKDGCDCVDNLVFDTATGQCVDKSMCTESKENKDCIKADPNTKFSTCKACPRTCCNRHPICNAMCTPGCECKTGYVISSTTGKCIPETSCPVINPVVCPGNTTYQECAFNQQCSKTSCQSAVPKNCKPGCACRDGYLENANGDCVLPANCDSKINCNGLDPNSEFSVCGTCRRICDDKTPICDAKCHIGCFCKKGYVLDKPDGKCILEKSCPTKPKNDDPKKDKSKPKKDDSKKDKSKPKKEDPKDDKSKPKKDDSKKDPSKPKHDDPKKDKSKPKKDDSKNDPSKPKHDDPKNDKSKPKKEDSKNGKPKKDDSKKDPSKPKHDDPKKDKSKPKTTTPRKTNPNLRKMIPKRTHPKKMTPKRRTLQNQKRMILRRTNLIPKKTTPRTANPNTMIPKRTNQSPKTKTPRKTSLNPRKMTHLRLRKMIPRKTHLKKMTPKRKTHQNQKLMIPRRTNLSPKMETPRKTSLNLKKMTHLRLRRMIPRKTRHHLKRMIPKRKTLQNQKRMIQKRTNLNQKEMIQRKIYLNPRKMTPRRTHLRLKRMIPKRRTCQKQNMMTTARKTPQSKRSVAIKCPPNSTPTKCKKQCPSKCPSKFKELFVCLPNKKCQPGCDCNKGYVLNNHNQCVLPKDCPSDDTRCLPGLHYENSSRPQTCEDLTLDSLDYKKGCFCKSPLVFDPVKKQCVTADDCSVCPELSAQCHKQDPNSVYSKSHICERCCTDLTPNPLEQCTNECICKDGYVRGIDNKCIPVAECPVKCGPNSTYREYVNQCGRTCKTHHMAPYILCALLKNPGCDCDENYVTNEETGECVLIADCPSEECPPDTHKEKCSRPRTCEDIGRKKEVEGCFCKEPLVYHEGLKKCVNSALCPNSPENLNCLSLDPNSEYVTSHICERSCTDTSPLLKTRCGKGCVCKEGFVRNAQWECVPKNECLTCGPNATYTDSVDTCGRTCGTYNLRHLIQCEPPLPVPGCNCNEGFVLNSNGQCVVIDDCTGEELGCPPKTHFEVSHKPKTCNDVNTKNYENKKGCFCDKAKVYDEVAFKCVAPEKCAFINKTVIVRHKISTLCL